jgi:uncharacterized RDD family membrane protein YckC
MNKPKTSPTSFQFRLGAFFIDYSIIASFILLIVLPLGTLLFAVVLGFDLSNIQADPRLSDPQTNQTLRVFLRTLTIISSSVVYWFYSAFLESSKWQATIGKRIMGLYITDTDGKKIAFRKAALRSSIKIFCGIIPCSVETLWSMPLFSGICYLGFGYFINLGMVLLSEKHQGVHDKVAETFVAQRRTEMPRKYVDRRTYNIGGNSLVVTGDNPVITDVQVGNINFSKSLIDFADELSRVRAKVEEQPPSEERNIAIPILGAAEAAARKDDIHKVKERLSILGKQVGKWVYDFAVEIGANVVAEALIHAAGLK